MASVPACVDDFEQYARIKLPKQVYDYYYGGADDEVTLKRNREAFKRLIIRPRFMRNMSTIDTAITLLNGKFPLKFPICLAPTASQRMCNPEGESATAKAAEELGTIMIVSTIATTSLEDVAKAAPGGCRWFQLYVYKNRAITESVVKRVVKAGYEALVVTVDTPKAGKRRSDVRNGFALPAHLKMANFVDDPSAGFTMNVSTKGSSGFNHYVSSFFDDALSWETVDWLRSIVNMPIMLKGILTAEDADEACQHGIDGIIVSNHGARQLDSAPSTIEALPEVVKAVRGRCDVYLDGGIRTGNDVFKALALGAKAVFVGRAYLWGLSHDGKDGVKTVINMLKDELTTTMALAGCKNLAEIRTTKNLVVPESYYENFFSKL